MPPRFHTGQNPIQRPLQNEILTLQKMLNSDVIEQAARILEHYSSTRTGKLDPIAYPTPQVLIDQMLEKSANFELVCDQIYYILEQSKRVLQLEWQQQNAMALKAKQNQPEPHEVPSSAQHDFGTDLSSSQIDLSMDLDDPLQMLDLDALDSGHQGGGSGSEERQEAAEDDEDEREEMLQLQRERLERLRNVVVHGMDADSIKANESNMSGKDDLLF